MIKSVDVITQVEKVNKDLAENEIQFCFKPSKAMITSGVGYVKYYFRMTDDAQPLKNKFDINRETIEFKHKLAIDASTFAKEIRKRELVLKLKKKKLLMYRVELDTCSVKLQDLYTKSTITKEIKLNGLAMEVSVSIHKAVRKEMMDVNNPRLEVSRIPKAWRKADGSRIEDVAAT